ncbi:hypothetical protein [Emticicia sp. BO119]|uniref:hypothetical protein n=1 Tax=Emticicia sp. BO119 TaxID=2757768 RepID=UPI0015F039DC|nr:hypothetical protein [Emticicia sp. BO119]MBA4852443.1 hypothetical protein [Emticicia sp. BO119]
MLTDEQIFDILDGVADAEVLQQHIHLLADSVSYQQYFNELATIHFELAEMPLEKPSLNFTANVLEMLSNEEPAFVLAKKKAWSAKWTYGFIGTMLVVLLTTILVAIFYQPTVVITVEQPNEVLEFINGFMTSYFTQIAILLNLIILLVLFDRKVLQPYFKHRRITLG